MRSRGIHTLTVSAAALTVAAGAGLAVAATGSRQVGKATVYRLSAKLSAAQETPRPKGKDRGTGTFAATLTLNGSAGTLVWRLGFGGLSGPVTASHVHQGAPGKAGPVVIPLCAPCKSGVHGSFKGPVGGDAAFLKALLAGGAYVNLHTKLNPGGEIRGQVVATPMTTSPTGGKSTSTKSTAKSGGGWG